MRKIAMVGTAPSTRALTPFADTSWEIWLQADYWADVKRADRWYELATLARLKAEFPDYLKFLSQASFPVWMRAQFDEIPQSRAFPFDDMAERYGREFMSATVVWMMAHAISEHEAGDTVESIGLFGYDMALDSEYSSQRPGIRHLEWIARQAGIAVLIPRGSDLSITPIPYPFADDDPMVAKIRARGRDLRARIAHTDNHIEKLEAETLKARLTLQYLKGALEDNTYYERMAVGVKDAAA